jgi:hypothetical protein
MDFLINAIAVIWLFLIGLSGIVYGLNPDDKYRNYKQQQEDVDA